MKKIIIIAALAASSIGIAACSSQSSPAPTVTVTQAAPVPAPVPVPDAPVAGEDLYLTSLKSMNNPILNISTDAELLKMGYAVCDALNAGFTVDDVIQYMAAEMASNGQTSDMETKAVGYIIGAADLALCPSASF